MGTIYERFKTIMDTERNANNGRYNVMLRMEFAQEVLNELEELELVRKEIKNFAQAVKNLAGIE